MGVCESEKVRLYIWKASRKQTSKGLSVGVTCSVARWQRDQDVCLNDVQQENGIRIHVKRKRTDTSTQVTFGTKADAKKKVKLCY